MKPSVPRNKPSSTAAGLGVAIGAGLGITVAALTGAESHLGIWIAVGAGVGVAVGSAWDHGSRPGRRKRSTSTSPQESGAA